VIEQYRRLHSAVRVESPWWRAAIGGLSGLSGAIVAGAVTDSVSLRLLIVFFVTAVLVLALSALFNHLPRLLAHYVDSLVGR